MRKDVRQRPDWLRALGRGEPPQRVSVGGEDYALQLGFKHDSWAATALYASRDGRRITCKFNRRQPAFCIPLGWVGRWLARREAGFLRRLAGLDNVPDDLGPVSADGRLLPNAVARVFVEGEPFRGASVVDAAFFSELRRILDAVHAEGIAYVDLHKRENIIIDPDGRPHLIDFQVSLGKSPRTGRLKRFIVRKLQEMDDYHYRKHYARCLPHLLSAEELALYTRPPAFIRAHRRIAVPLRGLRRRLLSSIKVRDRSGEATSEFEPEAAFRNGDPQSEADKETGRA